MRVTVMGSGLISLSTASHLARIGYEVTVVYPVSAAELEKDVAMLSMEARLFRKNLEDEIRQSGVTILYGRTVDRFVLEAKVVRAVVVHDEAGSSDMLMADRFVVALEPAYTQVLKTIAIYSPLSFKPFNQERYRNPLIGRSHYNNLYLNAVHPNVSPSAASESGELLADFIYAPALVTADLSSYVPPRRWSMRTFLGNLFA